MFPYQFELFVDKFRNRILDTKSKQIFFEVDHWKNLEKLTLDIISSSIPKDAHNDLHHYIGIKNSININTNVCDIITKNCFFNSLYLSKSTQQLIYDYFIIVIDDNYKYEFNADYYDKSVLYLYLLMIPIINQLTKFIIDDYNDFTKILNHCNILYWQYIDPNTLIYNILYSDMVNNDDESINELILFFKNIKERVI